VLAETYFFLTGPWAKGDTGAFFKAALLSGPPGVGEYLFALIV
jgi:replication factor C subunit 1